MIGRYLDELPDAAADRVLTTAMGPTGRVMHPMTPCLVEAIHGVACVHTEPSVALTMTVVRWWRTRPDRDKDVAQRFDALCRRVGTSHATHLIRDRVLRNKLRRTLDRRGLLDRVRAEGL